MECEIITLKLWKQDFPAQPLPEAWKTCAVCTAPATALVRSADIIYIQNLLDAKLTILSAALIPRPNERGKFYDLALCTPHLYVSLGRVKNEPKP